MPNVSITEQDHLDVAAACLDAKNRGDMDTARRLNVLCRKMNGALANGVVDALFKSANQPRSGSRKIAAPGPLDDL